MLKYYYYYTLNFLISDESPIKDIVDNSGKGSINKQSEEGGYLDDNYLLIIFLEK